MLKFSSDIVRSPIPEAKSQKISMHLSFHFLYTILPCSYHNTYMHLLVNVDPQLAEGWCFKLLA